ncbi:MAG TPA: type II toxin-antitoxin system RelE/ParE family toxin [Oligoflexia bacterium]|nr:type II toxin-antitoxin system RelE/ParE family toxin [Oligoflexia bacterium]HMP48982.1 type II toxin-antitoxin system RelE/ParE family toxin [Oligoflexia bacterium]
MASGATWYDRQVPGLGDEFLGEYRLALDKVLELPLAQAADSSGMRFQRLKRFPYRICYRVQEMGVQEMEILVAAVFHMRRNPDRLSNRR